MTYQDLELPDKIRFTGLQMKVYTVINLLHTNANKQELLDALNLVLADIETIDKNATNWRSVLFQIANKIN